MKFVIAALALGSFAALASGSALAADTCAAQATAKKLHGAAETSFVKKCTADVKVKCDADLKTKSLHGAAATSFSTKCLHDGTGA